MKKFLALMLALVMVFSLAACGNDSGNSNANSYKVAMITDYGDITDQSFNQTTYEACKAFCDANKVDFRYYKPNSDSDADRVGMIEAAIADGHNIVVMPGFAFAAAIQECAPQYPDVKFIALDVSAFDLGPLGENVPDNLYSAVYQEELSGYMAGYAAVMLGYTHLGYLGGMAVPAVQRFGYGYLQGVDAAAKKLGNTSSVTVEYVYGNAFSPSPDITAYMDTWYSTTGVEVVFACGGGIFGSAAEAAAKVDGKVIGVDVDQAGVIDVYGKDMTVTSAMKGLAATVKDTLTEVVKNNNWSKFGGKVETLGLISGTDPEANYVQIPMGSTQWADGFTQDDYKALVKDMFDGTIKVSDDITAFPVTEVTVNDLGAING